MEAIILASSSPRRQEILKMLGISFKVMIPNIDEVLSKGLKAEEASELFAREKVAGVLRSVEKELSVPWILGADTTVIKGEKLYRKPKDTEEASVCLKELQGSSHSVITTIALYNGKTGTTTAISERAEVTFASMNDEEIAWYVATGEWHGVAGGYRIQGLASYFIKKIDGTQSAVAGLPIHSLYTILRAQGYSLFE